MLLRLLVRRSKRLQSVKYTAPDDHRNLGSYSKPTVVV